VRSDVAANPILVPQSEVKTVNYDFTWVADNYEEILAKWNDLVLDYK
jgi:hypothetical protein